MSKNLKIIVPIAGEGTRLRPHTFTLPKPLIPVAGRPMLAHVLDPLVDLDPDEVVFVVGYMADHLEKYIRSNYSFKSRFVFQQDLLGLGYAVYMALEEMSDTPVLIVLGDTIAHADFSKLKKADCNCLGLKEVDDPRRFGVANIVDGQIVNLVEKPSDPSSRLAVIGLYYFARSDVLKSHLIKIVENNIRSSGEIQLTDAMQSMIKEGHIFEPCLVDGWYDCGKFETILDTNRKLLRNNGVNIHIDGVEIIPPIYVSPDAIITNSKIGPNVSISDAVRIENSEVSNSIILNNASIKNSKIDSSLIGQDSDVFECHGSFNIANQRIEGESNLKGEEDGRR